MSLLNTAESAATTRISTASSRGADSGNAASRRVTQE